jgi:hypothetical protein
MHSRGRGKHLMGLLGGSEALGLASQMEITMQIAFWISGTANRAMRTVCHLTMAAVITILSLTIVSLKVLT